MIRIAIADEHRLFRWALHKALAAEPDLAVIGEAGSVEDTLEMVRRVQPDVLLLDTTMPDHGGVDLLAKLRTFAGGPRVVVLAPRDDAGYAARMLAAGAHGYLCKSAEPEKLIETIHAVERGERVIPPDAETLLALGQAHPTSTLTARELEVMEMLARGMTCREIAHDFQISTKTVDTHRGHVLKKLGLRNNAELARFAVKHGYVTL